MSKAEDILNALAESLRATGAKVERNAVLPEKIPHYGLIIVRDGNPGEPDTTLGGYRNTFYSHEIPIEIYLERPHETDRDQAFDALLQAIGALLEADLSLGGNALGLIYGRPEIATEPVLGAPSVKFAVLTLMVDYEAAQPLS